VNGSHALVAALALMVGAAIPTLIRWTAMPLIIAGLAVTLGMFVWIRWESRR
jgi:hypothetical protein